GRIVCRKGSQPYTHATPKGNRGAPNRGKPMQEVAGLPILGIEHDFTRQEGLPLVSVSPSGKGSSLGQSRFADDPATLAGVAPQRWRLPLAVGAIDGPKHYILLEGSAELTQSPPLLVNAGQLGYTRAVYPGEAFD